MISKSSIILHDLLPSEVGQDYWNKNIRILINTNSGSSQYLSMLFAYVTEAIFFCEKEPNLRNRIYLITITNTSWQFLRPLFGISKGDDITWYSKRSFKEPETLQFLEGIKLLYNIQTFLRHPLDGKRLENLDWFWDVEWPDVQLELILETAHILKQVLLNISNEFSTGSGFESDIEEKIKIHEFAKKTLK